MNFSTVARQYQDAPLGNVGTVENLQALKELFESEERLYLDPFGGTRLDFQAIAGEASIIYFVDREGSIYKALDCATSNGSSLLGHNHPALRSAFDKQFSQIAMASPRYLNPARAKFFERTLGDNGLWNEELAAKYRMAGRNSGSAAIDLALQVAFASSDPAKKKVLAMNGAYHGSSFGAKALMDRQRLFSSGLPTLDLDVEYLDFDNLTQVENALREHVDSTVAVVFEPIQGSRGIIVPAQGYLDGLYRLCNEHGVLSIADEIKTFARTGRFFASTATNDSTLRPDIIAIGKGISMGTIPASCVLAKDGLAPRIYQSLSTYDSAPITCAVALAGIEEIVNANLLGNARERGEQLAQEIKQGKMFKELRKQGLMFGVELTNQLSSKSKEIREQLIRKGLALNVMEGRQRDGINPTLELLPPLNITEEQCSVVADILNTLQDTWE